MRRAVLLACIALAACGAPCPSAELAPLPRAPAFAIVLTTNRYDATAVALLDTDESLLTEAWVDSGTRPAGLATALSGDVVLPTTPLADGMLTLIDRKDTDVLTRIALPLGAPVTQISLRGASPAGWSPNPLAVLALDATHALVTRRDPNAAPTSALDRGSDLAVVDLTAGSVVSAVDLSFFETDVGTVHAFAHPNGLARARNFVVVGLDRLTADNFDAAPGLVAVLDPATLTVTGVAIMGALSNCGAVRTLPGTAGDVAVVCQGQPFVSEDVRARSSGVALVRVAADGSAMVFRSWRASDHHGAPAPTDLIAPLDATHVAVSARGGEATPATFDRLMVFDFGANDATLAYTSTLRFALQSGAFDAAHTTLLAPEGPLGVHRFGWDGATLTDRDVLDVSPCRRLSARQVAAL